MVGVEFSRKFIFLKKFPIYVVFSTSQKVPQLLMTPTGRQLTILISYDGTAVAASAMNMYSIAST
jgi:hypothetical protein